MASNSILKLQVDDKQYESSLKSAQQGLQALMNALRNSGKSFSDLDKNTTQYVRALGNMEATAKTTRGRIGEMSSAFVELSQVEKQLTDQERQSPVGKALTESLEQLKHRTIEAKKELSDITNELNGKVDGGGGLFGGGKLDGMLQVFGGNLMTKGVELATGAITSMVSETGEMIKQGIELARQGEGIRIAFERLGRGDILNGLREATHGTVTDLELMKAAVKFNDFKLPVEELGTMLAFAQQKAKDTGQSVDYMVDSIVTGLGRKSLMILDNLGLSAAEIKEKMAETGDMTKAVGAIIREQMAAAGDYVETAADRAQQANVSLQNKMEELGRKFGPLQEASNNFWTSMKIGILDVIGGPLTNLLNKLTEAGRMMNAYSQMGGNGKVGQMTANLAGAREGNRQSIYQKQQQKFLNYINSREQQIKDIRAWQRGQRGEALQGHINAITQKYGSLDATKIQAEVDAAKKMLADYKQAAKGILTPVKVDIKGLDPNALKTTGGSKKDPELEMREYQLKKWEEAERKAAFEVGKIREKEIKDAEKRAKELQPNTVGISIQSNSGMSAYISDLKKQIDNADIGSYMYQSLSAQLADTTMLQNLVKESMKAGLGTAMFDAVDESGADIWTRAMEGSVNDADWQAIADVINKKLEEMGLEGLKLNFGTGDVSGGGNKEQEEKGESLGDKSTKLVSGLSSVASGLQQMGIKLPEGVQKMLGIAQGVMTVVSGVGTIISVFQIPLQTKQTISTDVNTTTLIANTAALWSVEAALWAVAATSVIPGFANGGIVPHAAGGYSVGGNHYSGDVTPILANAGEVVLSRSQVGNLAEQLEGNNVQNMRLEATIKGEDIRLSLNNNGRRTGRGEYVTTNFR